MTAVYAGSMHTQLLASLVYLRLRDNLEWGTYAQQMARDLEADLIEVVDAVDYLIQRGAIINSWSIPDLQDPLAPPLIRYQLDPSVSWPATWVNP